MEPRAPMETHEPSGHRLSDWVHGGQQHVVSWSDIIGLIGRSLFIKCLLRLSRSDYGSVACLNRDFNSLVRSGEIYRLRRNNGIAEWALDPSAQDTTRRMLHVL